MPVPMGKQKQTCPIFYNISTTNVPFYSVFVPMALCWEKSIFFSGLVRAFSKLPAYRVLYCFCTGESQFSSLNWPRLLASSLPTGFCADSVLGKVNFLLWTGQGFLQAPCLQSYVLTLYWEKSIFFSGLARAFCRLLAYRVMY